VQGHEGKPKSAFGTQNELCIHISDQLLTSSQIAIRQYDF